MPRTLPAGSSPVAKREGDIIRIEDDVRKDMWRMNHAAAKVFSEPVVHVPVVSGLGFASQLYRRFWRSDKGLMTDIREEM
jgi:hypothetical protein